MKKIIFWVTAACLPLLLGISQCDSPPPFESPPSLVGIYFGTYTRAVQAPESLPVSQHITWVFTDTKYYMDFDSTFYPNQGAIDTCKMCDVAGIYLVSSGVLLTTDNPQDSNRTNRSCNIGYAPDGQYVIDQSRRDTVVLSGGDQNSVGMQVTKRLQLVMRK